MEHPLNHPTNTTREIESCSVYITADALISSLGFGTHENLAAIRNYQSGVALHRDDSISDFPILAATIDPTRLHQQALQQGLTEYPRLEQLFILTINDILVQSGSNLADGDCGIILSTTKGNIDLLGAQMPEPDERVFLANMAARIGAHFHTPHSVEVISNACISGVSALVVAKRWIETGVYRKVIVVGGDLLSHFITSGFLSFKSVSKNNCLPYDARRDGLNLGEACGAILLCAEGTSDDILLSGGAISNDANHISGPSRTGDGLCLAIRQAMDEASVTPETISFVNTHGTATVYNDEMESKAIHLAGLQKTPIHSLKPYFGHTLGASGVIESIICIHELKEGTLFGTVGYKETGVPMPILVSATHQSLPMRNCVKTASGFGGCNAAIVLSLPTCKYRPSKEETSATSSCTTVLAPISTTAIVTIESSQVAFNNKLIFSSSTSDFAHFIREAYKYLGESNMKFYKMDDLCKLGYVAAAYLLKGKSFLPEEIGILLSNAASSLDTDFRHQATINKGGDQAASPALFVYTLPNVVAGEICIRHKIQGENTFFVSNKHEADKLECYARTVMAKGKLKACITGWCELLGEAYKAEFKLIEIQ